MMRTTARAGGLPQYDVDVVVVGSGVAGMTAALGLARTRRVLVVEDGDGSTRWAQGGIAAAFADDDPAEHAHDTHVAGGGICDPVAVQRLVEEGPLRLAELVAAGARLDRTDSGALCRSREGGHRSRRIVHAGGDSTGAEVWRVLRAQADRVGLQRLRRTRVTALTLAMTPHGPAVTGLEAAGPQGRVRVRARAVVLATGGIGHVFGATTNPAGVRGEGLALALRAGATLTDLEFVQFHPTALATSAVHGQLPLVTEALRGEGAVLLDRAGRPFMRHVHPAADLAPRDVVAAAIHRTMTVEGTDHVWLDARAVADVRRRFPTVAAACSSAGVDPARDPIPVRPAAHFLCGGVATDAWGATDVPGLYAVGEVAATGVHGANRLASNSLLEGLVYGARVAAGLTLELPAPQDRADDAMYDAGLTDDIDLATRARTLVDRHAGIIRDAAGLDTAASQLRPLATRDTTCLVASAVVAAAAARHESVGCHLRADAPASGLPSSTRVEVRLDPDGVPCAYLRSSEECVLAGAAL
jgi:L-aspartate oxidase